MWQIAGGMIIAVFLLAGIGQGSKMMSEGDGLKKYFGLLLFLVFFGATFWVVISN